MSNIKTTVQSNTVTLSQSNFTVPQRRLLYAVIETISPYLRKELDLKNGREIGYQLGVFDISKITYRASDICRPEQYSELRTALEQLKNKNYFIKTKDVYLNSSLVLKSKFDARSEIIELAIDEELFKILLDSDGYTLYQTKVALSFSSIYAMKMYELIAQWRGDSSHKSAKTYSISSLRWATNTENQYTAYADFKKRVIEVAKAQLDKSDVTDLRFTYKEIKQGRQVVALDITIIKTENSHEHEKFLSDNAPSLRWDFSKPLLENFESYGIVLKGQNAELIKQCKNRFGERWIAEKLAQFAKIGEAKNNLAAYVISCFKNELDPNLSKKEAVSIPKIPQPIGSIIAQEKEVWEMSDAEKREYIAQKRAIDNEPLL